jgi:hypothetical protein
LIHIIFLMLARSFQFRHATAPTAVGSGDLSGGDCGSIDSFRRIRFEIAASDTAVTLNVAVLPARCLDDAKKRPLWLARNPAHRNPMFEDETLLHVRAAFWAFVVAHKFLVLSLSRSKRMCLET